MTPEAGPYRVNPVAALSLEAPVLNSQTCHILQGGPALFAQMERLVHRARKHIHLQVFLIEDDSTGQRIANALQGAASRGVRVQMLLDAFGCRHLPTAFIDRLRRSGIELRFFSPLRLRLPLRFGRRLHHKLIVVDGEQAIVGGANIADRYHGTPDSPPWLDFAVQLEGTVCNALHNYASRIFERTDYLPLDKQWPTRKKRKKEKYTVRILENDFLRRKIQIRVALNKAAASAEKSIVIFSSYFLPKRKLVTELRRAAKRGVEVKIVLQQKSDVAFFRLVEKYNYTRFLSYGFRIFEYTQSILHAKVAAIDHRLCIIGSYNLNDLSDLMSLDLAVEIRDEHIAGDFQRLLSNIIEKDCEEITVEQTRRFRWWEKGIMKIHYLVVRFAFRLMFLLTDKKDKFPVE